MRDPDGGQERREVPSARALLSVEERVLLASPNAANQSGRADVLARVRARVREELPADIELLREHQPELFEEIQAQVCPRDEADVEAAAGDETGSEVPTRGGDRGFPAPGQLPAEVERRRTAAAERDVERGVRAVVDAVAEREGWSGDERDARRRKAACAVLQYAVANDADVRMASDVFEDVWQRYPIGGVSKQAYWRSTIRPVLREVGEFVPGRMVYTNIEIPEDAADSS